MPTKAYARIYITIVGTDEGDGSWTLTPAAGKRLDESDVYSMLRSLGRCHPDADLEVFECDDAASISVAAPGASIEGRLKPGWRRFSMGG